MWNKVPDFIRANDLLQPADKILAAVSGGADSVALLLVMQRLGYKVEAVHCNFHLRGAESDHDEQFVKTLCDRVGVKLHLIHFDTKTYAELHQVSIEMAARELRYRYFEQLRHDIDADVICVAHHRDDNVETVLMNLIRSTGIHGLTGIKSRNGHIVRPLLCVSRQEIEQFLLAEGQSYVTDSTNLSVDILRNKLRLSIIPRLTAMNPAFSAHVDQMARYLQDAETMLADAVESAKSRCSDSQGNIVVETLRREPAPAFLLHEWLSPLGFTSHAIEQLAAHLDTTGRIYTSPTHELVVDRGCIVIVKKQPMHEPIYIPEPGVYQHSIGKIRVEEICGAVISRDPSVATIDADSIRFPLTVRHCQPADRFSPFGMQGSRLVSDFLTDKKVNLIEKRRQLVVTDATKTIVWLVGYRTDNRFRIVPGTTARTLKISIL